MAAKGITARAVHANPLQAARVGPWDTNRTYNVDCLAGLKQIPSNTFDVSVTSPPYWGQRGYGGLGSEADPREYIENLTTILAEVMRCLKPTGTFWLNIGDSYNTPINWGVKDYVYSTLGADGKGFPVTNKGYSKNRGRRRAFVDGETGWLQYGNLLGIPYRVVIAMGDRGFLFRGEVIWYKAKAMPEGLCRRPHRRHEGIYIFAKDERHLFKKKPPVGSVWHLRQTPNMTEHCSAFPLDLPLQCIDAAGIPERGLVLDPFMGSGTTAKAARQRGHDFLGFELDPAYCELANKVTSGKTQQALAMY